MRGIHARVRVGVRAARYIQRKRESGRVDVRAFGFVRAMHGKAGRKGGGKGERGRIS